jgi:hypothetical protein
MRYSKWDQARRGSSTRPGEGRFELCGQARSALARLDCPELVGQDSGHSGSGHLDWPGRGSSLGQPALAGLGSLGWASRSSVGPGWERVGPARCGRNCLGWVQPGSVGRGSSPGRRALAGLRSLGSANQSSAGQSWGRCPGWERAGPARLAWSWEQPGWASRSSEHPDWVRFPRLGWQAPDQALRGRDRPGQGQGRQLGQLARSDGERHERVELAHSGLGPDGSAHLGQVSGGSGWPGWVRRGVLGGSERSPPEQPVPARHPAPKSAAHQPKSQHPRPKNHPKRQGNQPQNHP